MVTDLPHHRHLLQRLLQAVQARSQAHADQLSDAVSMVIDDIPRGAAAVVAVQGGGALQADGQVARLAEEAQLLARVEGAEDGAAQTTTRPQLVHGLHGVRRRSLLSPAERREADTHTSVTSVRIQEVKGQQRENYFNNRIQ